MQKGLGFIEQASGIYIPQKRSKSWCDRVLRPEAAAVAGGKSVLFLFILSIYFVAFVYYIFTFIACLFILIDFCIIFTTISVAST